LAGIFTLEEEKLFITRIYKIVNVKNYLFYKYGRFLNMNSGDDEDIITFALLYGEFIKYLSFERLIDTCHVRTSLNEV
jgi:hypothetical protein